MIIQVFMDNWNAYQKDAKVAEEKLSDSRKDSLLLKGSYYKLKEAIITLESARRLLRKLIDG